LAIREEAFGIHHPSVAIALENMARCCSKMGKKDEEEKLNVQAKKIKGILNKK